jgi:hypothetical protein
VTFEDEYKAGGDCENQQDDGVKTVRGNFFVVSVKVQHEAEAVDQWKQSGDASLHIVIFTTRMPSLKDSLGMAQYLISMFLPTK